METYQGILYDNRIEWSGKPPQSLPADQAVRVHVTILEKLPARDGNKAMLLDSDSEDINGQLSS